MPMPHTAAIVGRRFGRVMTRVTLAVAGVAIVAAACGNSDSHEVRFQRSSEQHLPDLQLEAQVGRFDAGAIRQQQRESGRNGALRCAVSSRARLFKVGVPRSARWRGRISGKAFRAQDAQLIDVKNLLTALKKGTASKVLAAETTFEESEAPLNQQFDELGLIACGSVAPSTSPR